MLLSREQMVRACLLVSGAGLLLLFFLSFQQNYVSVDEAVKLPAGSAVVASGIVKSVSSSGGIALIEICQNSCIKAVAKTDSARASFALLSVEDIVRVEGRVSEYRGKPEIEASKAEKVG